jgi:hypothetical protein
MWWMGLALGATVYVFPEDDLQSAVWDASPGDVISLEPGTHRVDSFLDVFVPLEITSTVPGTATLDFGAFGSPSAAAVATRPKFR